MSKPTKSKVTPEMLVIALADLFGSVELVDDISEEEEKAPRTRRGKKGADKKPSNADKLKQLAEDFKKKFSLKELKELLEDVADVTSAAKVPADMVDDVIAELEAELDGEEEGEEEGDDEVTVEAVKIAVQAFQKKNGKEETEEILEDYAIKSVRSLGKLEQSQLEDLFADVTED